FSFHFARLTIRLFFSHFTAGRVQFVAPLQHTLGGAVKVWHAPHKIPCASRKCMLFRPFAVAHLEVRLARPVH
ncbi:MAG: hypothetical protein ACE5HT_17075, partial [Gemmatimonadales bacterium]